MRSESVILLSLAAFLVLAGPGKGAAGEESAKPDEAAYRRSVAQAEEALRRRPDNVRLLLVLADVHQRQQRWAEAEQVFEQASRLDPRNPDPLLRLGEIRLKRGELESAAAAFRKLLALGNPAVTVPARASLAEVHHQAGRYEEAAGELRSVLKEGGRGAELSFKLALALDAWSRSLSMDGEGPSKRAALDAEAVEALKAVIAQDPTHPRAHYVLGMAHRRQGKADLALNELDQHVRAKAARGRSHPDPQRFFEEETRYQLARLDFEMGDPGRALEALRKLREAAPDFLKALALEGWILMRTGRLDDATRSYQELLQKDPGHSEGLWNLGKIYLGQGRLSEASPLLLQAVEVRKSVPEGWELLAQLAEEKGMYPGRAGEFAAQALKLRLTPSNYARLARVLAASGQAEAAERVIREGREKFPRDPMLSAVPVRGGRSP